MKIYERKDMGRWGIHRTLFGYPLPRIRDGKLGFYLWNPPHDGGWIWFAKPKEKWLYAGRKKEDGALYWCFFGFCGLVHL